MTTVTFLSPYHRPFYRTNVPHARREPGADYESMSCYGAGDTATFPTDEAADLISRGIAIPASSSTNGGTTERTV
jgi:hypothetical protein